MIEIRQIFRGFKRLNLYLLPIYLLQFVWLSSIVLSDQINIYKYTTCFIGFIIGSQMLLHLGLIIFAKSWDYVYYKSNLDLEKISTIGCIFGAVTVSGIITIFGNVYADNLFQFKRGNYIIVSLPFFVIMCYYRIFYNIVLSSANKN